MEAKEILKNYSTVLQYLKQTGSASSDKIAVDLKLNEDVVSIILNSLKQSQFIRKNNRKVMLCR
jgi:predicted transcriptional regulator